MSPNSGTPMQALEAENQRLRDLYENVVNNREAFGWTINHLLECEEALRTVEAAAERFRADAISEVARALRERRFGTGMRSVDALADEIEEQFA